MTEPDQQMSELMRLRNENRKLIKALDRYDHLLKIAKRTLESGAPRQPAIAYIRSVRSSIRATLNAVGGPKL